MTRQALGVLAIIPAMWAAQGGQASRPDVTIRATTRLVEVTVVAQGKHGELVRDLNPENFQVLDEGSPQRISFFSLSATATAAAAAGRTGIARSAPARPELFSNRADIVSGPAASTIVLIDLFAYPAGFGNAGWADLNYVKQAAGGFLRQIRPGDRVGVYLMAGDFIKILYEPAQDPSEVLKWLAARSPGLDLADALLDARTSVAAPDLGTIRLPASFHDSTGRHVQIVNHTEVSLALFAAVARHLAGVPGRKNLIWVSPGFTLATAENHENRDHDLMLDTMRVLNSAGVCLYAVDSRGLVTLQPDATVRPPLSSGKGRDAAARAYDPQWAKAIARTNNRALELTQGPMLEMSALTGGRAFFNTNDIQGAIRTVADEASATYTLGFYPDSPQHNGKFHRIEVKIAGRRDVNIRYRMGYTDTPDPANNPEDRTAAIRDAIWSPLDATGVALQAQVVPAGAGRYELRLRIDPRTLNLEETRGQYAGRVDVVVLQEDPEGNQFDQSIETMVLALGRESYQKALAEGLEYDHAVEPNAQANALKVIVRDAFSGNLGSLTIPAKALEAAR